MLQHPEAVYIEVKSAVIWLKNANRPHALQQHVTL